MRLLTVTQLARAQNIDCLTPTADYSPVPLIWTNLAHTRSHSAAPAPAPAALDPGAAADPAAGSTGQATACRTPRAAPAQPEPGRPGPQPPTFPSHWVRPTMDR